MKPLQIVKHWRESAFVFNSTLNPIKLSFALQLPLREVNTLHLMPSVKIKIINSAAIGFLTTFLPAPSISVRFYSLRELKWLPSQV